MSGLTWVCRNGDGSMNVWELCDCNLSGLALIGGIAVWGYGRMNVWE